MTFGRYEEYEYEYELGLTLWRSKTFRCCISCGREATCLQFVENKNGKKYFAVLEDYIRTLEESWSRPREPIWKADIPGMNESISFYARTPANIYSGDHFTYHDFDGGSKERHDKRKKLVEKLTRILFPPVDEQSRVSSTTHTDSAPASLDSITTAVDQLTSQLGSVDLSKKSSM
ncbi:hypothetical protein CPB85DRAFT_1359157 [Mucidula mucida]|nr:hypothetical protein CPB85DRAFT_1359157 [Mucidula mucida]